MKKSLLMIIAVIAGTTVRAATVDWQYKITKSSTDYSTGYMVYLVDATKWDNTTISKSTFTDSSIVYASTTFATGTGKGAQKTYATIKTGSDPASAGMSSVALSDDIITAGGIHDFYFVVLNNTNDPNTYYVSSKVSFTGRAGNGTQVTTNVLEMQNEVVSGGTWTPIPEPTSGLLTLLGFSALLLKRKQF